MLSEYYEKHDANPYESSVDAYREGALGQTPIDEPAEDDRSKQVT